MTLYKDYECLLPHMVKHFQKLGDIFKVIKKEIENSMEDFEHIGKDIWEALTKKIY